MVLDTKWTVQSLEEHRSPGTFLLICGLWRQIVSCQKGKIETSSGLYHKCQSRVWGERELHGLLYQRLQRDPLSKRIAKKKGKEKKKERERENRPGKWHHWGCGEEKPSPCCARTGKQTDGCWADCVLTDARQVVEEQVFSEVLTEKVD